MCDPNALQSPKWGRMPIGYWQCSRGPLIGSKCKLFCRSGFMLPRIYNKKKINSENECSRNGWVEDTGQGSTDERRSMTGLKVIPETRRQIGVRWLSGAEPWLRLYTVSSCVLWISRWPVPANRGSRRGWILWLHRWKIIWSRCWSHGSIHAGWFQSHNEFQKRLIPELFRILSIVFQKRVFKLETFIKQGEVCSFRCKAGYQTQVLINPLLIGII